MIFRIQHKMLNKGERMSAQVEPVPKSLIKDVEHWKRENLNPRAG